MTSKGLVWISSAMGGFILVVFAAIFAVTFHETYSAQSWSETDCEIFGARIKEDTSSEGEDWDVMISWRYTVGAVQYENVDADPAVFGIVHDEDEAKTLVARYVVGSTVRCWYDPEDPKTSALDRSTPPWSAIIFAIAVAVSLLAGGLALVVLLLRKLRT